METTNVITNETVVSTSKKNRKPNRRQRTPQQRFERYLPADRQPGECWEWQGGISSNGYGIFWTGERLLGAHVWAVEQATGQKVQPVHQLVMHSCDNPKCCNPAHLSIGSPHDNQLDAAMKLRKARKLTKQQVYEIREALLGGETMTEIGSKYGVSQATVSHIHLRKTWGWLADQ